MNRNISKSGLISLSMLLVTSCGWFNKKSDEAASAVTAVVDPTDYEGFSTEKFAGTRDEALQIAGQLVLDSDINLIETEGDATGLRLQAGNGDTFDTMRTNSYVYDPSLSLLKQTRSMLCVLAKLDYEAIPESEQTVSAQVKECFSTGASSNKSSSSGSSGSSSSSSSSSSSQSSSNSKGDLGLADITWQSYVNVDEQLIVIMSYEEEGSQEWMPTFEKEVTFVIKSGSTAANPFGSYFLRIKGYASWDDEFGLSGDYGTQKLGGLTITRKPPKIKSLANFGLNDEIPSLEGYMVVDSSESLGLPAGQVYVTYNEANHMFGNTKRMSGVFTVDSTLGTISNGQYIADIKGWDEESGEPGGYYRVAFDATRLHREKSITDIETYYGPDFDGVISTAPVSECFQSNAFTRNVHGYRLFNIDGSALDDSNGGFSFAAGNGENDMQGWASYWGIDVYSPDGTHASITDGMTVYKLDWDNPTDDGRPGLGAAYTIESKPGKLSKQVRVNYDMTKANGKTFEGWYDYSSIDGSNYTYRVRYDSATGAFYKTQRIDYNSASATTQPQWEDVTEEIAPLVSGYQYYMWSPSLTNGTLIVSADDSGTITAYIDQFLTVQPGSADVASALSLVCVNSGTCPKPGITAAQLEAAWADYTIMEQIYYTINDFADVKTYTIEDFTLKLDGTAISPDFSATSADTYLNLYVYGLIPRSDYSSIAANSDSIWDVSTKATTTYNFEMGNSNWSKTIIMRDANNNIVSFDPPQNFELTLTADNERFGETKNLNQSYALQADSGYLWVPWEQDGFFTDPLSGETWENWVPSFALKDGTILTDASSAEQFKIKAEFIESRMKTAELAECGALPLPTNLTLPEEKN
ncbi:MAG: hypothetical protein HRU19_20810 [Pseudobacteriovorax sp.]|nr:hypothetical protein [Pseudobacteriovorax sp.]